MKNLGKQKKQRRADEVFDRWASEPGEKDSTALHRAFKSRPGSPSQTKRLGKTPAEPKGKDEWEEAKEKDQSSSSVSSWGTGAYHHSQRFRDGMKAEDDSERSSREALMAGGSVTSEEILVSQHVVPGRDRRPSW
jgi:hypothetical protein